MSEEIRRVITIEDNASDALDNLVEAASEAAEELNKVDVNIQSFDKTSKSFTNGLKDITEGLDQIVPGTKHVTEGFTKVSAALKALVANPVILGITAVVAVIYGIVKAIKSNENAMASLKDAFKAFEPVIDVFNDVIEATAKLIANVVKQLGEWITKITDFIGLTSDAKRAQKELAEQAKITNDIISKGSVEGVKTYQELISEFMIFSTKLERLNKHIGSSEYEEEMKEFLSEYKSTIETLSRYSGTFHDAMKSIQSPGDIKSAYDQISSLQQMREEFYKTSAAVGGLSAKKEKMNSLFERIVDPSQIKSMKELRKVMQDAYTVMGLKNNFDYEYSRAIMDWGNYLSTMKTWAIKRIRSFSDGLAAEEIRFDLSDAVTLDLDKIFQEKEIGTPKITIPIDLSIDNDALEEGLSQINDNTDFSKLNTDLSVAFDTSYYEKMLNISSEQLENLHEYTTEYYDKMREVEEWAWKTEEARLQAEGYTNSQIEKLRKEHNNKLEKINKQQVIAVANATSEGLGSLASMFDAFADLTGEESEQAFETSKKLQIASAVVTMLQGIATAVATGMQLGPIAGPIVGAVNAATVMATGIAQISKIKATKFDNASASGATVSETATSTSYNPTYTANTTGASDIDALQGAVASGTSSGASAVKVYVTESDITNAQNARKVKVTESTF